MAPRDLFRPPGDENYEQVKMPGGAHWIWLMFAALLVLLVVVV